MHESVLNGRIHDELILLSVVREKCGSTFASSQASKASSWKGAIESSHSLLITSFIDSLSPGKVA